MEDMLNKVGECAKNLTVLNLFFLFRIPRRPVELYVWTSTGSCRPHDGPHWPHNLLFCHFAKHLLLIPHHLSL